MPNDAFPEAFCHTIVFFFSARICSNPILPTNRRPAATNKSKGRGRVPKVTESPGRVISTRMQTGTQPRMSFVEEEQEEQYEEEEDGESEEGTCFSLLNNEITAFCHFSQPRSLSQK